MSRSIGSVPLVLLLLAALATAPAPAQGESIGEKPFYKLGLVLGDAKRNRDLDTDVLNAATSAFVESRRFSMVERSQLDKVFTEKDLQSFIGKGNPRLSDLLDLDLIGVVVYFAGKNDPVFTMEVRLVEVKTGQILGTISSDRKDYYTLPTSPRDAGRGLFRSVREVFPPYGYIVQASGETVIVDLGSDSGVKKGDALEIIREGEQIIHPVTGAVLPGSPVVVGELKVVSTSSGLSNCKIKSRNLEASLGSPVRLKQQNGSWKGWLRKGQEIILGDKF